MLSLSSFLPCDHGLHNILACYERVVFKRMAGTRKKLSIRKLAKEIRPGGGELDGWKFSVPG